MFTGEFSGLFAPMYKCSKHGEIWHVLTFDEIDKVNDEEYQIVYCAKCGNEVTRVFVDGVPVMHPLTDEEAYWETYTEDEWSDW
jgi:hypothetical protein